MSRGTPRFELFRRVVPYAQGHWITLGGILCLTLLAALATALQPWPLKLIVDYALDKSGVSSPLPWLFGQASDDEVAIALIVLAAAASLALLLVNSALDALLTYLGASLGQRITYACATDLFDRMCRLRTTLLRRGSVGDFLSRIGTDSRAVYTVLQGLLMGPTKQVFTLCMVAGFAWAMNPMLTVLSLALAPVMALASRRIGAQLKQRSKAQREAQSKVMAHVQRTLSAMPVVQAFGAESRNQTQFEDLSNEAVTRGQRSVLLMKSFESLNGVLMTISTAVVVYVGCQHVLSGRLTVGGLLVFMTYLHTIRTSMVSLLGVYGNLKVSAASIDRISQVLDSAEVVEERAGAVELRKLPESGVGEIRFERVTVGYEAGRPVLHDISLRARPGEVIAFVGRTGAGKSTLVSLLPRFLDPWEGRVMVGDQDIRDLTLSSLRSQIGLVLQDAFLLPLSVADNIAYGRPDATREQIVAAARTANADEFIRALPDGYDTVLGERGATLSGGQSQRLSIARALLKDAPILILDEPTSALDAETEALLLSALKRLVAGRTTFIIAHRLSTIRHADQIILLDNGRIAERGSHDELLLADGAYARFHRTQRLSGPAG